MIKLGPRKRIDPARIPKATEPQPACCAFCGDRIARPTTQPGMETTRTGACDKCSAVYVDDANGKLGGEAFVAGLTLLADGDIDRGMGLREGRDYQCKALAYNDQRHEVQLDVDPSRYGVGRMWYFRRLSRPDKGG